MRPDTPTTPSYSAGVPQPPEGDPPPMPRPPEGDPPPRDPEQPHKLPGPPTRPVTEPPDDPNRGTPS